jgi:hypothetical protein
MANKHANLEELFSAIADAIRVADDKIVGTLVADDFPEIISNIESGVNTDDADAEEQHIQIGKIAYVKGQRLEGTLNPSPANIKTGITIAGVTGTYTKVDSNAAAAANIETGKIAFVNGSQITGNLPNNVTTLTFSAATNNTSSSAIAIQSKHSSKFICNANTNMTTSVPYANIVSAIGLTAAKIADGENVLGVTGTYTEEPTATAAKATEILNGKYAYVNGARLKGSLALTADVLKYNTVLAGITGTFTQEAASTAAAATDIRSGKYAYVNGARIPGSLVPKQVSMGEVSDSSQKYTLSTNFTPTGFMMVAKTLYFDSDDDIFYIYALDSTTCTAKAVYWDNSVDEQTTTVSTDYVELSDVFHSAVFKDAGSIFAYNEEPGGILYSISNYSDNDLVSVLDTHLDYYASNYTDGGDSTLTLWDTGLWDYADTETVTETTYVGIEPDVMSPTCTVTYSSTGAVVTVPSGYYCPTMAYVVWG